LLSIPLFPLFSNFTPLRIFFFPQYL
jgi:hypothetical protein